MLRFSVKLWTVKFECFPERTLLNLQQLQHFSKYNTNCAQKCIDLLRRKNDELKNTELCSSSAAGFGNVNSEILIKILTNKEVFPF